jgi:deoxyribose-phosphate aldolase
LTKQHKVWDNTLARVIDHTVLGAKVDEADVRSACAVAQRFGFATVVASPEFLRIMVRELGGSPVRVCTVVSFPTGEDLPAEKAAAAKRLIERGADEIDVVMNVEAFAGGDADIVREEVKRLTEVCRKKAVLKLIIETPRLGREQISQAAGLAADGGVDFVKTTTGTATRGVSIEDVTIIRAAVGDKAQIKAAGGIRTAQFAHELLSAGAHRLGCSASIDIVTGSE